MFDFQLHSTASDGTLRPKEVVALCARNGLKTIAITDHDTVAGVEEALTAGSKFGVRVIPGCELSVEHNGQEFDILCYHIDHRNLALVERMAFYRQVRIERAHAVIAKLQKQGFAISFEEVAKIADGSIGRPHIAKAIFLHANNVERLAQIGIKNPFEFVGAFMTSGKDAYVEREKFRFVEAISLVHNAGGVGVLAHPGWTFRNEFEQRLPAFLSELKSLGLDGVETFYRTHEERHTRFVHSLAVELDLKETAGSDFHNPDDPIFHMVGAWESFGIETNFEWITQR